MKTLAEFRRDIEVWISYKGFKKKKNYYPKLSQVVSVYPQLFDPPL